MSFLNFPFSLDGAFLLLPEKPEYGFLFVAAVTARVDADCGKLAAFAPAFDRKGRNSQYFCYFADG
jgi:hypothetical protein